MFLNKLKYERTKRGLSQQVLGYRTSVGSSDISKFENGRAIPYPSQAKRLAKVLGLSPSELQEPVAVTEVDP